ncbi:GGDEF domain-containing protein [Vibrio japonicus]|uniref:diguanylate cyclase n=1 Tax=Vibrio japonicus TaxID=1824638 RepID=A0ABY5LKF4_9VIBR|nr:GGDEF domain-containing protein [Vibrio japonicus]UUM32549.1 GGDEF domain-containing protein [Vibrio japonicus]
MPYSYVTTIWFRLLLPIVSLICLYIGFDVATSYTESNIGILSNLPYVLFLSCIALARAFKQNQIAMLASTLIIAYWLIQTRLQSPLASGSTMLELSLLAALLPMSLALVFNHNESTSFAKSLIVYLATIISIVLWCYLMLSHFYEGGLDNINETFLFVVSNVSRIPFILVVYFVGMILVFAICLMSLNRTVDVAVYSSALLAGTTFILFHIPYISSMLYSMSGILLLIYLVAASYEMAFNDQLTEIPGRLALETDLKHLGKRYCIAMLDVDHFKSFNDNYGHDTGDEVLRLIAQQLTHIKGNAKVYRYGGEEFAILFRDKSADEVKDHLERLRISIASYDLHLRDYSSRPKGDQLSVKNCMQSQSGEVVNVTISIGVCDNTHHRHVKQVLKQADVALYEAKQKGRNRVCFA